MHWVIFIEKPLKMFFIEKSFLLKSWGSYGQEQPLYMVYKGGLKNLVKMHGKPSVLKSTFNKIKIYILIKMGLQYMCFCVNFAKFLGAPLLKKTSRRLLLCGHYFKKICFFWRFVSIQLVVLNTQQFSSNWLASHYICLNYQSVWELWIE